MESGFDYETFLNILWGDLRISVMEVGCIWAHWLSKMQWKLKTITHHNPHGQHLIKFLSGFCTMVAMAVIQNINKNSYGSNKHIKKSIHIISHPKELLV